MKYKIMMKKTVVQTATLEIEAETAEKALSAAKWNTSFYDSAWATIQESVPTIELVEVE